MKHVYTLFKGFSGGLLGLLILAGCSNALLQAPRTDGASPEAVSPAGTGRLTISLTGTGTSGGERTLFPSAPVSFSKYELAFTPRSGQAGVSPVTFTGDDSYTLSLPTGEWTIEARAYVQIQGVTGIANGNYVAARGSKAVTVGSEPGNISIDLRGGIDGGKGVFSYDTPIASDLDSATLEILDLVEGTPVQNVNLKTAASGSIALDSGYYLLKISRVKGAVSTVGTEVIHIYDGLTTKAAGPDYDFSGQGMAKAQEKFTWLANQLQNTAENPYPLALEGLDLRKDLWKADDPLGLLYEGLNGKFVDLDLSACRGDYIPSAVNNSSSYTAQNRPNRDNIVSLILPDTLTDIGDFAFGWCESLVDIDWPDALTTIITSSFRNCTALTTVDLSGTRLAALGQYAFGYSPSLEEIKLPDTLKTIGSYAFINDTALKTIELPDSITRIDGWAFQGSGLESIVLPSNITSISYTFQNCAALKSVGLPAKLTEIGSSTFSRCEALEFIDLPATLTSIGSSAFGYCTALETVISRNTTPPTLNASAFSNASTSFLIYVPDASVDAYKSASAWSVYASQIKPLSELPAGE
jgi:hypothetical protein